MPELRVISAKNTVDNGRVGVVLSVPFSMDSLVLRRDGEERLEVKVPEGKVVTVFLGGAVD